MKQYTVRPAAQAEVDSGTVWAQTEALFIDCFPWDQTGYRPKTQVQMVYSEHGFWLRYETEEAQLRAESRGICSAVCEDSAVELFLMPDPAHSQTYVNLECNALCAMYLGVGTCREDNVLLAQEDLLQFRVHTEISLCPGGYRWVTTEFVPYAYLQRHTGCAGFGPGSHMRANFYKLAEKGPLVHYGCWNPIDWPLDDFHRPEFFGDLILA